jgi:hypothetical protein
MKDENVTMRIKGATLLVLTVTMLVLMLSGPHTAFGQDGPETPQIPNAPSDSGYAFIPIVIKPGSTNPPPPTPPPPPPPHTSDLIIDHNSVALFESIPDRYLTAARNTRMLFSDRSVGSNIDNALNCLSANTWASSASACRNDYYNASWSWRTFTQTDYNNGTVPERILFEPDPVTYNRSNWTFVFKQGTWNELTRDFIRTLAPQYINTKDVLTYQFSYLNVEDTSDIANPNTGFFANNSNKDDVYDLEAYIASHPDKTFFLWTTSLARGIGNNVATDFNEMMREYAVDHGYFLFDVADIESFTDKGEPCYDNRDGVQYCSQQGACENHPNDGQFYPAICQDYTTETDGGHLGSVSGGQIRLAKAYWVLMARIAGWDGVSP